MTKRAMSVEAYELHQRRIHAPDTGLYRNAAGVVAQQLDDVARQATLLELRTVSFEFEMPPSVNDAWHHDDRTGGKVLTDEHRQFRTNVISRVGRVMRNERALLGRIEMSVRLYFKDHRRTDIDNRVKPLQDALTHARAYRDDSQIDRLIVERILGRDVESCDVTLREIAS